MSPFHYIKRLALPIILITFANIAAILPVFAQNTTKQEEQSQTQIFLPLGQSKK